MEKVIEDILSKEKITDEDYFVAIIDGSDCQTLNSFLKNIGVAFKLPSYYGQNLDALNECLNDLEWLDKPNYILVIKDAEKLLCKEPMEIKNRILALLESVSREWANVPNYEGEEEYRERADFRIKLLS
jgi:RNAse (barnase) inhibitor barstar